MPECDAVRVSPWQVGVQVLAASPALLYFSACLEVAYALLVSPGLAWVTHPVPPLNAVNPRPGGSGVRVCRLCQVIICPSTRVRTLRVMPDIHSPFVVRAWRDCAAAMSPNARPITARV